jgi:glucose/arabinose dehydrogenase
VNSGRPLSFESLEARQLLAATPIAVHVAGSTGTEAFELQIDGFAVATWTNTRVLTSARVFDTFNYTHPTDVTADRIRVAFINDGNTTGGADRNLFVDGITLGSFKHETEDPAVYSTGTWDAATNDRLPGFRQTEALHYDGYFQYAAIAAPVPTPISVHAAGSTGTENLSLLIDGVAVASWNTTQVLTSARVFQTFTYTHPSAVSLDRIRVAFTNDGTTGAGADRNLFVDGITLGGVKYESEAPTVYSTGTWDPVTNGLLPGFRQTEALHYDGYLQYAAAGTTIQIHAAGETGEEQMELLIAGQSVATFSNVGGNASTGVFEAFTYNHPTAVAINDVRIAFTNDAYIEGVLDRNLRVDAVLIEGVRHETESAATFSTGTYIPGPGVVPGYHESEYLHAGGYFQYGATASVGSTIEIRAAGVSGEEEMQLVIAGQPVAVFTNVGGDANSALYQSFRYDHPTVVDIGDIRISFTNDGTSAAGVDRNLRIDGLTLDGVLHHAEAANVFSTGTYIDGIGIAPGLWQNEYLHTNGDFQFGSTAVPGVLALGASLITVNETAGTVSIPVVRTGGSDGTVGLQYTTVNATATAGSDYTATSGLILFGPGETVKSIVVSINNDALDELNEVFNVASDLAVGGATLNQPRTATITIVDNDGPPDPGNGNGLLAAHYNDTGLSVFAFERTEPTINASWGAGSPLQFSIRWTGQIQPLYSETYTFHTLSGDGVRLWINNQLIVNQWNPHPTTEHAGSIALVAGQKYDLRLEYYEWSGDATIVLSWSSASQLRQVVPQSQLYSDPPIPIQAGTFSGQTMVSGLVGPTAIDFDSSGRMFVSEQWGVVRVYQNGQLLPVPFIDIRQQVNNIQDRGMLGVAVHPNFPATPYVYVSYTYDPVETLSRTGLAGPDGGGNRVARVTRFTANPATGFNTAIPGSEVVIVGTNSTWANISRPDLDSTENMNLPPSGGFNGELQDILIADSRSHTVGNIGFGPDGMLYVANGDGASYGRVDARAARVQSVNSLSGKLLRVDPLTGDGLADNPFYNGNPDANRSKVFNLGLRNPFRFAFHPETGVPYIGDVGWNAWEEINIGVGENFGWPWYEGGDNVSLQTGGYRDLPAAQAFYASNPDVTAPLWSRSHAGGGVAIVAGDFYTGSVYPESFRNTLFLSDFGDNQLRVMRSNDNGTLHSVVPLNLNVGVVVEMSMGADGYLYYVDITGRIGRLLFTPTSASLLATAPGDFDGDGAASGQDFLAWQRGLGVADATLANGDADGDGSVTVDDLNLWREGFAGGDGAAASGLSAAAYWLAFEEEDELTPSSTVFEQPVAVTNDSGSTSSAAYKLARRPADESLSLLFDEETADGAFEALAGEGDLDWMSPL